MNALARFLTSQKGKNIIFLILSVLYIAGVICLFIDLRLGVIFWAAAMLPSLMIYIHQKRQESILSLHKAQDESAEDGEEEKEA